MKLHKILSGAIVAFSVSLTTYADTKPVHSIGMNLGGGGIEHQEQEAESFASSYLFYNYQFSALYSLEVGLLSGVDADWDCREVSGEWECYSDENKDGLFELEADSLELGALVLALKGDMPLSKRNKLYGKVGLSLYNYELELHSQTITDEDGVGFMLEAGWEYRWDLGIGMNVGLQHHKMDELKFNTLNIGVSYSF